MRTSDEDRQAAILTVMVLMTLADGEVADGEVTRMRWIHKKLLHAPLSAEEVQAAVDVVKGEGLEIDAYLERIAPSLDPDSRRRALQCAYAIASADGQVADEEDAMMVRIAKAFEIKPAEYRAALSNMMIARVLSLTD